MSLKAEPQIAATGMSGARRDMLLAGGGAFVAALASAMLGLALLVRGLGVLWPAAGVVTGLWLITPRHLRVPVLFGLAFGLATANALAGRSLSVNFMFVIANLAEAWMVRALLERWAGGHPVRLETLTQVGWFVLAVGVALVTVGTLGSLFVASIPGIGFGFSRNLSLWIASRGIGTLTVAPAIVALGTLTRAEFLAEWRRGRQALWAIALLGIVLFACITWWNPQNDLLGVLLLLAIVCPFVLWMATKRDPAWTYVALTVCSIILVWRLGAGSALFGANIQAAQAFLLVTSLWALTLAVVLRQQRLAMDEARRSESSMRHALAAGRGFTFAFDPRADIVVRADPDAIVAPFMTEPGSDFLQRVLPEDRARLLDCIAKLTPGQPMYEVGYGSRRPDGKLVWLQERAVGEFDGEGQLVRLQGLTMDVTARREYEEALREADRQKDRFIATLAHELRNPLAPIRTAAGMLGSVRAGSEQAEWARKVIQRQVAHMAHLLDDLLDVARITRGKLELRREHVRLDAVVETAVEVARPLIDARQQRLSVELPSPCPVLEADPLRLSQVVSNLLTNAAKYSDAGGEIRLQASVRGETVEIKVRDTGIGMPPDAVHKVFEMFAQIPNAAGRSEGGLGIGLSLVKGLVELHGGKVSAYSAGPGQGSEFTVTLPCLHAGGEVEPGPVHAGTVPDGRRVLVVDDNRDAADSLALLLRLDGHDVRVAYAGLPALEEARSFKPDVAILDLGLPDMSGHEVARSIRDDPSLQSVTLIALTGWGKEEDRERSLQSGFDHHLTKPVDPERLVELLEPAATPGSDSRGSLGSPTPQA